LMKDHTKRIVSWILVGALCCGVLLSCISALLLG